MESKARSESGQIIVILALAFVGLLGFAALAIDTGMIYSDRRANQNASDAAALDGVQIAMETVKNVAISNFQCDTSGNWVTTTSSGWGTQAAPAWLTQAMLDRIFAHAKQTAQKNGISIETGLANHNGVAFRCGKESGVNFLEVRTEVTTTTNTSFLQIFYGGKVKNTVEAVAYGKPSQPYASGFALYGLDQSCSNTGGINLNGGGNADPNVRIKDAGAYSSSCMTSSGHAGVVSDTPNSCMYNPDHPDWCNPNDANFVPRANAINSNPYVGPLPEPNCNNRGIAPAQTYSGPVMSPGYYDPSQFSGTNGSKIDGHDQYQLKPGLYCFDIGTGPNARLALNGGGTMKTIGGDGYSEGVTIVIMSGSLDASGGGGMELRASKPDGTGGPYAPNIVPGVVLMASNSSSNTNLTLGGNSGTKLWGTVYIPKGIIDLGGTGDVYVATQFIAFGFRHHGTATAFLDFKPELMYQAPPSISLRK